MPDIDKCIGCLSCAAICPGLAATIVDYRKDPQNPTVTMPYEIWRKEVEVGALVPVTDEDGAMLGKFPVQKVVANPKYPGTLLIQVKLPKNVAKSAVGIWVQEEDRDPSEQFEKEPLPDEAIICRCERVSAGEIRAVIRSGVTDMNQLKAVTRAGMGACGAKTCRLMIQRIFREEGIDLAKVTDRTDRPLFVEVTLGSLAGEGKE
jgi:bacterioferritin-associated ferredoxin